MPQPHSDLFARVQARKTSGGIVTVQPFQEQFERCVATGLCEAGPSGQRGDSSRLVYDRGLYLEKATAAQAEFADLLPDGIKAPANTLMLIHHKVTTPREDRDRDVLETSGAMLDPKAPLLWQHLHHLPLGSVLATLQHDKDVLRVASALIDLNQLTADAAKLVEAGALRFSHGFRALEFEERKDEGESDEGDFAGHPGFRVTKFEIMEVSLVSVPSNVDAEIELYSRGKLASPEAKAHAKLHWDARTKSVAGYGGQDNACGCKTASKADEEPEGGDAAVKGDQEMPMGDLRKMLTEAKEALEETLKMDVQVCKMDEDAIAKMDAMLKVVEGGDGEEDEPAEEPAAEEEGDKAAKRGRVISQRNANVLTKMRDGLRECLKGCEELLKQAQQDSGDEEGDEERTTTVTPKDAAALLIAAGDEQLLKQIATYYETIKTVQTRNAKAEAMRSLI